MACHGIPGEPSKRLCGRTLPAPSVAAVSSSRRRGSCGPPDGFNAVLAKRVEVKTLENQIPRLINVDKHLTVRWF